MKQLENEIKTYLKGNQIEDKVSLFYYKPLSDETYLYREDELFLAASAIKVPVVMAWLQLIQQNIVTNQVQLQYCQRHYEESDEKALYDSISFNETAPVSLCMKLAIVYSDNPSNHMMKEYYQQYSNLSFREWFAQFSKKPVNEDFYTKNQATASIMLEVMKELYNHSEYYSSLIEDMKIAAKGRYIQANHFDFEVAQKYGEYQQYEHTMAILYMEEPILVGIFTELATKNAKEVIQSLSKMMAQYNQQTIDRRKKNEVE